tara:strand:+ start:334 stop:753 length:420 start_codon:yes stop_codon:yes gene_type:complete
MKFRNIWNDVEEPLELHTDERGSLVDLFYNETIQHAVFIDSKPNAVRGNHYHKNTEQHLLVLSGELEYWYKNVDDDGPAKMVLVKSGDIVSTPPNEIHALVIGPEGNTFIAFASGMRGGKDYENDTFRVDSIIGSSSGE